MSHADVVKNYSDAVLAFIAASPSTRHQWPERHAAAVAELERRRRADRKEVAR